MPRVAMIVSTVGYHWEEVFRAYWELRDAGYAITIATVDGTAVRADPLSLAQTGPGAFIGLGMPASIDPGTDRGHALLLELERAVPLASLDADRFDTLYLPGGHGCLFDVNRDPGLHAFILNLYARGCILGGVCHATSAFAFVEINGRSIVAGHAMTGFPAALDRTLALLGLVRPEFLPLPIVNDEVLRHAGAKLSHLDAALACANPRFMRVSLPFITGVGPKAAARVARAMIRAIAKRSVGPTRNRVSVAA